MNKGVKDFSSRNAKEGVAELFSRRWSPRSYKQTPVSQEHLNIIFDAARWSPSCYNEQPWMFITSTADTHDTFVNLLVEGNQRWAKLAPVIGFVVSAKTFQKNGNDNVHARFDSGAAWMAVNLQASLLGLYAHGMGGVHYEKIYETLSLDQNKHDVICGFTLGYMDESSDSEELTLRKPLEETWQQFAGEED